MSIEVNKWSKVVKLTKEEVIRFQLLVHCNLMGYTILKEDAISFDDIERLLFLASLQPIDLTIYCRAVTKKDAKHKDYFMNKDWMFKSIQSARNFLGRMEDKELIEKKGNYRKVVYLHPSMQIQTEGNIMLDIKALYRE